ncbi:carboxymuconolactone decarboxylase family protein [Pseudoteredinibacter isoporae]|uniref:Putative peroxidase-related enzyme n=1 Tax=Pseudoteredinibacter isoporae TaxID=570281 RepID=A0A7X0JV98_9GAMM|nr:carboxymuconolactone decarboxylase family protein [Pseudoteredinibacter isoporae]MBB6522041.1 putative peroxidase-related enzyme [Pseudoteredinibacter isoporae]NHO87577.1 carboxymuconolactone decarboxylase family protein [Pseudoteredinibacter isoporae]NIB24092.1 carboxymuconolactone decarboxylase family protein [Pseudoteredinibacter isoporae]
MAHLRPLDREEMDDELQALYQHYENTRGFMPNSIRTMARRPNIAKRFGALNQAVLYEGTVSEELKMLVSLISSQASGCRYCQSHMANLSSIYKASDKKIAAVWEFESSELFDEGERAALRLAYKASLLPNEASNEDFAELAKHFDEGQVVEIVASVALFGFLNRWNDTMSTELETLPKQVAERALQDTDWEVGKHQ